MRAALLMAALLGCTHDCPSNDSCEERAQVHPDVCECGVRSARSGEHLPLTLGEVVQLLPTQLNFQGDYCGPTGNLVSGDVTIELNPREVAEVGLLGCSFIDNQKWYWVPIEVKVVSTVSAHTFEVAFAEAWALVLVGAEGSTSVGIEASVTLRDLLNQELAGELRDRLGIAAEEHGKENADEEGQYMAYLQVWLEPRPNVSTPAIVSFMTLRPFTEREDRELGCHLGQAIDDPWMSTTHDYVECGD